jgi:hypothetical protein
MLCVLLVMMRGREEKETSRLEARSVGFGNVAVSYHSAFCR